MCERTNNEPRGKRKLKNIIIAVASTLAGASVAGVASAIVVYNAVFPRYERPDYNIYPGLYDYGKIKEILPRERLSFTSGSAKLSAYYYPSEDALGLVVLAHGFRAGADDYLPLIEAIVKGGYAVFTYDATGTYDSGGDSAVGMCQSLCDLDRALTYIRKTARYSDMPLFLVGHSWGGYAAASVLELHPEVKACVCIAPMNDGTKIMLEKAEEHTGKIAYAAKPIFDAYQKYLFGDYVNYNGVRGINSTDIPILIAQGVDDTVITMKGQSITAYRDKLTNPNVSYYFGKGAQGSHTGIWHSAAAEEYRKKVASELKMRSSRLGRELTYAEKCDFYSGVDHRLYSEVNSELVELMLNTFKKPIK